MSVTCGRSVVFSPSTPIYSINKIECHDITEILLIVVLNTITLTPFSPFQIIIFSINKINICTTVIIFQFFYILSVFFTTTDVPPPPQTPDTYNIHKNNKIEKSGASMHVSLDSVFFSNWVVLFLTKLLFQKLILFLIWHFNFMIF